MLRKLTPVLLALFMLLCALPALADGVQLYGLYQDDRIIGTGVLLVDQQTLLTVSAAAEETVSAHGADGAVYAPAGSADNGDVALLLLDAPIPDTVLQLAPAVSDDALVCTGLNDQGQVVSGKATRVSPYRLNGHGAIVFSGPDGLLPGAVLLDNEDRVAGLVVARFVEGHSRYVAYTNESLFFAVSSLSASAGPSALIATPAVRWLDDATLTIADGILTVDWSACKVPDKAEDSKFAVVLQDLDNPTLVYSIVNADVTRHYFPIVPGRSYVLWVYHGHGDFDLSDALSQDHYQYIAAQEAKPFQLYDFADDSLWLGFVPAGQAIGEMEEAPAVPDITAALLDGSQDVYFQVTSHYSVTEEHESNLLISLVTPDGSEYNLLSGFLFVPEYMMKDTWHANITGLFTNCAKYNGGTLAPGCYTVSLYLDGLLADQLTFDLE